MHQEQVGLTACDADHTTVLVVPNPDQCQRFFSGEWVTDHFFI